MLSYFLVIALLVCVAPAHRAATAARELGASACSRCAASIDIGLLVLVVTGGIVMGWVTPSEAAAVGAVGRIHRLPAAAPTERWPRCTRR